MKSELGNRVAVIVGALCIGLAWASSHNVLADNRMIKIVMIGDSLTEGKGIPEGDRIPNQLEFALKAKGHSVAITNAGAGGAVAARGLAISKRVVTNDTDAVILELGWWDMTGGRDPNVTRAALAAILSDLEARRVVVLLCGVRAHTNFGAEHEKAYAAMFAGLAREYNALFYPAFNETFVDDAQLKALDGLHPNAAGNKAVVMQILPTVEALIDRARRKDR